MSNNIFVKQLNEDAARLKKVYAELEDTKRQIEQQMLMAKAQFDYIVGLTTRVQQELTATQTNPGQSTQVEQPTTAVKSVTTVKEAPKTEEPKENLQEQLEQAFIESTGKTKVVERQLEASDTSSKLKEEVKTVEEVKATKPAKETKAKTVKPAAEEKKEEKPVAATQTTSTPPSSSDDDDWGDDEWSESVTSAAKTVSPSTTSKTVVMDDEDDWGA